MNVGLEKIGKEAAVVQWNAVLSLCVTLGTEEHCVSRASCRDFKPRLLIDKEVCVVTARFRFWGSSNHLGPGVA